MFIKHYKQVFDNQEFRFIIHWRGKEEIEAYLRSHGFTEHNFLQNGSIRKNFGYGEQTTRQNRLKLHFLLEGYIVVYADIDELIYHPDFKAFILNSKEQLFCARGVQIVQSSSDSFLDVSKPIFSQRTMGKFDPTYSKVCVLKKDFTWTPGRHNRNGVEIQDGLWLFDIGRVCKKLVLENNKKTKELYTGIYPRYKLCTMEEVEIEYKQWLNVMNRIPEDIIKLCLF